MPARIPEASPLPRPRCFRMPTHRKGWRQCLIAGYQLRAQGVMQLCGADRRVVKADQPRTRPRSFFGDGEFGEAIDRENPRSLQ
jgi:hypothetical protein